MSLPNSLNRLKETFSIAAVLTLSLVLLSYIGFGEAYRVYPKFQLDKLAAQGEIVKNTIDTFLQAGFPLKQFIGFEPSTQPILNSDKTLAEITVTDTANTILFTNRHEKYNNLLKTAKPKKNLQVQSLFQNPKIEKTSRHYPIVETDFFYQVILPLNNKFESVGYLWMTMPKSVIKNTLYHHFFTVFIIMGILIFLYGFYTFLTFDHLGGNQLGLTFSYSLVFLIMAIIVNIILINIYSEGIQAKTKALTNSLAQRINAALELGLDITDFEGLDLAFAEYKRLNPDISFIGCARHRLLLIHTDESLIGQTWKARSDHFEYKVTLNPMPPLSPLQIGIGIPKKVVYSQLWRSVKNFSVLFVASAFLAGLFLNLVFSFNQQHRLGKLELISDANFKLNLIKPVFFLSVFIEGLNTSFLPIYFQDISIASGLTATMASPLFTLFFVAYAAVLIPAGRYADTNGIKRLLLFGLLLMVISMSLIAYLQNYYAIVFIRLFTGLGQGMVFIGVQSYILRTAMAGKTTQGATIIVFGYNGGMISGVAIGALLVIYMGEQGVFLLGAIIASLVLWYVWQFVPEVQTKTLARKKQSISQSIYIFISHLSAVIRDTEFVKTMFLIGILTKAVLTGVTIYALPLLMNQQNYAQEDIGLVLMLYAGGVLLASRYIARYADKFGKIKLILFWGTQSSGLGLLLMGLMEWAPYFLQEIPFIQTIVLFVGILILGLGHGFIHAPVVTYIANTSVATALGRGITTSVYRFLERLGHVIGPILVSQMLLLNDQNSTVMSWIGGITILFGLLFLLLSKNIHCK